MSTDQLIAAVNALVAVITLRNTLTNSQQIQACDQAMLRLNTLLSS